MNPVTANFDPLVSRAQLKWPDVPACFAWLALDARGRWRLRGTPISHARTITFLNRHYTCDELGRWFVQNGPQQVFVDLAYTPWIYRVQKNGTIKAHTERENNELRELIVDDEGNLLLVTALGPGLLDDRDLFILVGALKNTASGEHEDAIITALLDPRCGDDTWRWHGQAINVRHLARAKVAATFGFVQTPSEQQAP